MKILSYICLLYGVYLLYAFVIGNINFSGSFSLTGSKYAGDTLHGKCTVNVDTANVKFSNESLGFK